MSRRSRRINRSQARSKQSPSQGSQLQPSPTQAKMFHERLNLLENHLELLGKAFDKNTEIFSESFKMTEAMSIVLQKVMMDIVHERVVFSESFYTTEGYGGHPVNFQAIDFHSYLREYWLCMVMADFAQWCKRIGTEAQEPAILIPATKESMDTIVFGG